MNAAAAGRASGEDPGAGAGTGSGARRPRLGGVDIARVIAIAGMVMVHFGPNPSQPETTEGQIYNLSHGRASVLFALLAGVGVALLFQRRAGANPFLTRGQILLRAAILLPIGLWLQSLDHGVLVILQYYALYFVFAVIIVGLPDEWLLAGAVAVLGFGPLIYIFGESVRPEWYQAEPSTIGDPAGKVVRDLFLAGSYPLVTWAAPLLVGVFVGRRDLRSTWTRWTLVAAGVTVALLAAALSRVGSGAEDPGMAEFLSTEPHSQMPLWMLGAIGSALAILGGTLILSDLAGRVVWPLVAAGQLALSIYIVHLLVLHWNEELLRREEVYPAFVSVGVFMLVTIALCTLWRLAFSRGPLEYLLRAPWWVIERAVGFGAPSGRRSDTRGERA